MSHRRAIKVSLLHGTFATGSTWPVLEEEIRRQFSGYDVDISYPLWSGGNTVRARLDGASTLENHVLTLVRKNADQDHFIVAHSHGGNIALLALRNPEVRAAVRGIVCLSTPFLICRPRVFPREGREVYESAAFMGVVMFFWYIVSLAMWTLNNIFISGGVTIVALLCALPLFRRWHSKALEFQHGVTVSSAETPILVIRSPSDEASLLLVTFQAFTKMLSSLWSFMCGGWLKFVVSGVVARRGNGAKRRVWNATLRILLFWSVAGLVYFAFIAVVWGRNPFNGPLLERLFVTPGVGMFVALNLPFLASIALVVPLICVTAVFLLPFGPAYSFYAPFIEVSVEQNPAVPSQIVPLPWSEGETIYSDAFQHSRTHDDPRAASRAVDWIKQLVSSSKPAVPPGGPEQVS